MLVSGIASLDISGKIHRMCSWRKYKTRSDIFLKDRMHMTDILHHFLTHMR
jgi:hypothetical protein